MTYSEVPGAESMHVTLDVRQMRSSMSLWRDTLVLCNPEAQRSSELRQIQLKMLKELDRTLTGWLDLLKMCIAQGPDAVELQRIQVEVADCKAWAAETLAQMYLSDTHQTLHRTDQQP